MSPIHVAASLYLRVLCKIHVSGFMSQHLYISGSSARSMSPDPYISIHMYLRILCKIHVSRLMSQHLCISGSSTRSMSSDPCLSIFISQELLQDPCLRFMSYHPILWPCAGETQILTSGDAFCVALRRENSPTECFAQAKRKFWPPESRFLWHCAGKTAEARNLHLDLRGFTPTVRTPQCATLFGEKKKESSKLWDGYDFHPPSSDELGGFASFTCRNQWTWWYIFGAAFAAANTSGVQIYK